MLLASREEVASCGVTATDMVLVHLQAVVNADTGGPDEIARIESARLGMRQAKVYRHVQFVWLESSNPELGRMLVIHVRVANM